MTISQQNGQLEFKLMRCPSPNCNRVLFAVAGAPSNFRIRIKCRKCRTFVMLEVKTLLETPERPVVDSNTENLASA